MSPSRFGVAVVAAGALALSGCEEEAAPPAVVPPAPPAELSASFSVERVDLREGDTAEIAFEYEVTGLARPIVLAIQLAGAEEVPEDIELAGTEIPLAPGGDLSGEGVFAVTALADDNFAEAGETFRFEFAQPRGPLATTRFGRAVQVVVADTPLDLCEGVVLRATAIERAPWPRLDAVHTLGATLTLDLAGAARDSEFELRGPYIEFNPGAREPGSTSAFGIHRWRVETDGPTLRHELGVTWPDLDFVTEVFAPPAREPAEGEAAPPPPDVDARLVFAVAGPTCPADSVLSCDADGCYPTDEIQ